MKSKINSPLQGDIQKGNDSYHASSFGRSVESIMKSHKTLIPPLKVLTPAIKSWHTLTKEQLSKLKKNTV